MVDSEFWLLNSSSSSGRMLMPATHAVKRDWLRAALNVFRWDPEQKNNPPEPAQDLMLIQEMENLKK